MKTASELKLEFKEYSPSPLPFRHSLAQGIFYKTYYGKPDIFCEHDTVCPRCCCEFVIIMGEQYFSAYGERKRVCLCQACFLEFIEG